MCLSTGPPEAGVLRRRSVWWADLADLLWMCVSGLPHCEVTCAGHGAEPGARRSSLFSPGGLAVAAGGQADRGLLDSQGGAWAGRRCRWPRQVLCCVWSRDRRSPAGLLGKDAKMMAQRISVRHTGRPEKRLGQAWNALDETGGCWWLRGIRAPPTGDFSVVFSPVRKRKTEEAATALSDKSIFRCDNLKNLPSDGGEKHNSYWSYVGGPKRSVGRRWRSRNCGSIFRESWPRRWLMKMNDFRCVNHTVAMSRTAVTR